MTISDFQIVYDIVQEKRSRIQCCKACLKEIYGIQNGCQQEKTIIFLVETNSLKTQFSQDNDDFESHLFKNVQHLVSFYTFKVLGKSRFPLPQKAL